MTQSRAAWTSRIEVLEAGRTRRVSVWCDSRQPGYAEILQRWQNDAAWRSFFIGLLADAPFAAYCWETPPLTQASADRPFEFVLVDSPALASAQPEPQAFASHFATGCGDDRIISFANLGKDALLVVPCPDTPLSAYPHLAAFVRRAPQAQVHALWQTVGALLARHLDDRPVWLSSAGLGVFWLHLRLDSRPKYYRYRPYREGVA